MSSADCSSLGNLIAILRGIKSVDLRQRGIVARVYFAKYTGDIDEESKAALLNLAAYKDVYLQVEGYGDCEGTSKQNRQIGQQRAAHVVSFLKETVGLDETWMNAVSFGESFSSQTDSEEQRDLDRHVVVRAMNFSDCEAQALVDARRVALLSKQTETDDSESEPVVFENQLVAVAVPAPEGAAVQRSKPARASRLASAVYSLVRRSK